MPYRIELPDTRPADDCEGLKKLQKDLLDWAEELFGQRDGGWMICPPDFDLDDDQPHIYYPKPFAKKLVQIKLVPEANDKWPIALYQMAHEVIHLLNPKEKDLETGFRDSANVLEEGVACAFSFYVLRRCNIKVELYKNESKLSYRQAHKLVARLQSGDIAAAKRIRREIPAGTSFSAVTANDLIRIFPCLDRDHAHALTSKFCRDNSEFP